MPYDDLKAFRIRQSPKGGRKPAPGPDIEANILDAAEFVFGHFGFRGATTALIAKKAAIAKPHIYYYFEDKEDLYRAILERAMNMWARELETLDTAGDIQTILTRYIHKKVDFSRDHPDLSRLYANEIISSAAFISGFIEKVSTPLLREKVATVEAWAASGAVRPISAVDLFFCIWAMTQSYADFASQMTIMKRKKVLESPDYESAKATIVQLVLGDSVLPIKQRLGPRRPDERSRNRPFHVRTIHAGQFILPIVLNLARALQGLRLLRILRGVRSRIGRPAWIVRGAPAVATREVEVEPMADYYLVKKQVIVLDDLYTMSPNGTYNYDGGWNRKGLIALAISGALSIGLWPAPTA